MSQFAASFASPGASTDNLTCRNGLQVLKLAAFRLALMCDNFEFSPLDRLEVNAKVDPSNKGRP
jgi:hypothetical protein